MKRLHNWFALDIERCVCENGAFFSSFYIPYSLDMCICSLAVLPCISCCRLSDNLFFPSNLTVWRGNEEQRRWKIKACPSTSLERHFTGRRNWERGRVQSFGVSVKECSPSRRQFQLLFQLLTSFFCHATCSLFFHAIFRALMSLHEREGIWILGVAPFPILTMLFFSTDFSKH